VSSVEVSGVVRASRATRPSVVWINQFALLPSDGGGTRHFELGRELVRRGWQVTILASDFHLHSRTYSRRRTRHDRAPVREVVDGVEIRWLWSAPYERNNWRRVWNWLTFTRSVRTVASSSERPDLVIGSSPHLLAASSGRALARRWNVPFVFEVRDLWPESLIAAGGRKGVAYHLFGHMARTLYAAADRILVLAQGSAEYLIERGVPAEKLFYVPNGVDVDAIAPAAETSHHGEGSVNLVYAGAHGPANGLGAVLDAAEVLGPQSGAQFTLVGDGPTKRALVDDSARRRLTHVRFLDPMSKPALACLLASADAGLMLLRDAPLFSFAVSPNKLFDYMAAGLPIVCNVPGDVARMVRDAGAGLQARDASGEALADVVRTLLGRTSDERATMGRAGRAWVEREHNRTLLGARLDEFLRSLL
jgi:glycosyltransferase involved in cell wall biosynthesis